MKKVNILFLILVFTLGSCKKSQQTFQSIHPVLPDELEEYRPVWHFTPEKNWTNDPNGLVYYDGEYHLFYQYNPFGDRWGHMSWGHAVSRDLVSWIHLPVALYEEDSVMIFSGSAVVDKDNSSGLCEGRDDCMVAIYTSHIAKQNVRGQHQSIAYSADRGRTWTKYKENPVLDSGMKDFRDPKVFWHSESGTWKMVVSHPREYKVQFYESKNLVDWKLTGEFGNQGDVSKIWECPDLVKIGVQGTTETKWVLIISSGSPHGDYTGMQYFVGEYDGKVFKPDHEYREARWLEYGKDFYAAITYNNLKSGVSPILIGWVNNWKYANTIPVEPWRGMMSIPRELSLFTKTGDFYLKQKPVPALFKYVSKDGYRKDKITINNQLLLLKEVSGEVLVMEMKIQNKGASSFGVNVLKSGAEQTTIGYDASEHFIFVDRTRSGLNDFHPDFISIETAPVTLDENTIDLMIILDRSVVEVFVNEGEIVITDQVFPTRHEGNIELFAIGGEVEISDLRIRVFTGFNPS